MRILLTIHQFFPEYFSGTEVLTHSVARELLKRGHEVSVFTGFPARTQLPDEERFDTYDIDGIRVYRFHHAYVPMGGQTTVTQLEYDSHLTARYFARLIKDIAPDVIHFFHLSRLGGALIDVAVKAQIPAFYTPTDFWSICPTSQLLLSDGKVCDGPTRFGGNCVKHVAELTRGPAVKRISRFLPDAVVDIATGITASGFMPPYPMSTEIAAMSRRRPFLIERLNWLRRIISPTRLMTRVLTKNGVDPALIIDSAYGIDIQTTDVSPVGAVVDRPAVFGFIGTLAKHKGCHVLIEAFCKMAHGKARLKIFGNPSDFPDYVQQLRTLAAGRSDIEFCGTFPNSQVSTVIAGLDALVVPSLWYENTPLVVYSAIAAKRPVIASDFPGLVESVGHERTGLIFTPGDVPGLLQQLHRLIDEPDLLARLSAACRPPKSTPTYTDEILALYDAHRTDVGRAGDIEKARSFQPLEDQRGAGFMTGWAVIDGAGPAAITLRDGATSIGTTSQFLPRPDVRDSLSNAGVPVRSAALGFTIRTSKAVDWPTLTLTLTSASGRDIMCELSRVAVGTSILAAPGVYVGIDSQRQPPAP